MPADQASETLERPGMPTFSYDPEVIHKTWQRSYGGMTVRKDRDKGEIGTVDEDPLTGSVNG